MEKLKQIGIEFPLDSTIEEFLADAALRKRLGNMLWRQRDVFSSDKVPTENRFPHFEFHLPEGQVPVRQSPYRTTPSKQQAIHDYVSEMVKAGIAVPSISPGH